MNNIKEMPNSILLLVEKYKLRWNISNMKKRRKSFASKKDKSLFNIMGIIHDVRKRKFYKFNYLDLLVVAILGIIISIFLINRFNKKSIWIDARISIEDGELWFNGELPAYWLVEGLEPGMESYNSFGEKVATIEDVQTFSIGGTKKFSIVDLKLRVIYDKEKKFFSYNYQPLRKGDSLDFIFGKNKVSGLLIALDEPPAKQILKTVVVKQNFLEDWYVNQYEIGMQMIDTEGRVLATIKDITIQDTKISRIKNIDGELFVADEDYKDVILELEILTTQDPDGSYRFLNGTALKIGNEVWFHFPKFETISTIMEVRD